MYKEKIKVSFMLIAIGVAAVRFQYRISYITEKILHVLLTSILVYSINTNFYLYNYLLFSFFFYYKLKIRFILTWSIR